MNDLRTRAMMALSAAWLLPAVQVLAQADADTASGGWLERYGIWILGAVVVLLIVAVLVTIFVGRRPTMGWESLESEPEAKRSKYEQLLAEMQGLSLRMSGGESLGYYRKIDNMSRIFLERLGHSDARHLEDEEIDRLLQSGQVEGNIAQTLTLIFDRCRDASARDVEKLDVTAAELLKKLHKIVLDEDRRVLEKQRPAGQPLDSED